MLGPWILDQFPEHEEYVEVYGGGGSVLLRKKRSMVEVYNDLDGEVVNFFRVVRDRGEELREKIRLTPFSREEFELSYVQVDDEVEAARRTVVRSFMGYGSDSISRVDKNGVVRETGFRGVSREANVGPSMDWRNYPDKMGGLIDRMRGVVIENRDDEYIFDRYDGEKVLFYLDPPYVKETRRVGDGWNRYKFEMSDDDHERMIDRIKRLRGMVVLSGYENRIYDQLIPEGWVMKFKASKVFGSGDRKECLWMNEAALMNHRQMSLFK
jgi:DNA adenine methylase